MTHVHVLRVFADEAGRHGNELGVVLDSAEWSPADRQRLATRLGYSETVFVDDVGTGSLQLFTPARELAFAGHPLVGVSWLIAQITGEQPEALRPSRLAKPVPTYEADGITWVRGDPADAPPWDHEHLPDIAEVDALNPASPTPLGGWRGKTQVWAWADESAGAVRARTFAADFGVPEDEACGSASLLLCARLARPLTVLHGKGSVIMVRPAAGGDVEVGGRVVRAPGREVVRI